MSILKEIFDIGKNYMKEKQRQEQEKQLAQQKFQTDMFLQQCKRTFTEALVNFPSVYNVKNPLSSVSLHMDACADGTIRLRIPKDNPSEVLRRLLGIEFKDELQQRLYSIQIDARTTMCDLQEKQMRDYNSLANQVGYDHPALHEMGCNATKEEQNLLQEIQARLWNYNIQRVVDNIDSLYIEVYFTVNMNVSI